MPVGLTTPLLRLSIANDVDIQQAYGDMSLNSNYFMPLHRLLAKAIRYPP